MQVVKVNRETGCFVLMIRHIEIELPYISESFEPLLVSFRASLLHIEVQMLCVDHASGEINVIYFERWILRQTKLQ